MIEQLKFIESQIKETEREIKHIMDTLNSVILTIPGIGPINGATILVRSEIFKNFLTRKLVAYAGIDASVIIRAI